MMLCDKTKFEFQYILFPNRYFLLFQSCRCRFNKVFIDDYRGLFAIHTPFQGCIKFNNLIKIRTRGKVHEMCQRCEPLIADRIKPTSWLDYYWRGPVINWWLRSAPGPWLPWRRRKTLFLNLISFCLIQFCSGLDEINDGWSCPRRFLMNFLFCSVSLELSLMSLFVLMSSEEC